MRAFRYLAGLVAVVLLVLTAGAASAGTPTSLRIDAPGSVPAGVRATVHLRLLTSAGPVSSQPVLLQRKDPSGWVQAATATTGSDGLATVSVAVGSTARFRSYFRGSSAYASSTSPEVVINAAQTLGERAVAEAKRHAGQAYRYGAAGPTTFDCSGFTLYVYRQLGRSLPHNSGAQRDATRRIANGSQRPGDLIFTYRSGRITHVGLYAGGTNMWSPVQTGDHVRLQSFSGRIYTVGRVG
ncbi:MAG: NlpC/P60 family protein [Actinobacteria bacterium]|nr:NlpC/P60 family protein [Actinomycetota bacterium]MCA1721521.1 NlpC/P60 family protein [Actinomycetota bacterium]